MSARDGTTTTQREDRDRRRWRGSRRTFLRLGMWMGVAGVPVWAYAKSPSTKSPPGSQEVAPPDAHTFTLPPNGGRLIGRVRYVTARQKDTLYDIARRHDVGYWDIRLANPDVDVWLPGAGTRVRIPTQYILPDTPHEGIVVNVPETRIYYYPPRKAGQAQQVITHPCGLGRQNWRTPLGVAKVVDKIPNPTWYPPASIRAEHAKEGDPLPAKVPPGPDNPLGKFALILNLPGYLIHGTIKPDGVGARVSHGCIRLYPEDIKALFAQVPRQTPVRIINQPYKAAWHEGRLFLEAQPLAGYSGDSRDLSLPMGYPALLHTVQGALRGSGYTLDWAQLVQSVRDYTGIPKSLALM